MILNAGIAEIDRQFHQPNTRTDNRQMLAADVPFHPAIDYLLIWHHIARLRAGLSDSDYAADQRRIGLASPDGKDLTAIPVRTGITRRVLWPAQLVALFADQTTPAVVLGAAGATPGDFARRLRGCEANFYTAEYRLTKNDTAAARPLLQAAVDGCPTGIPEAAFARAELQRVDSH
jgi:hypothetical protein